MRTENEYGIVETAQLLGIKVRTVREWIRRGKLLAYKYPGSNRWTISKAEIRRLREKDENKD